jgi:hypothetical protein
MKVGVESLPESLMILCSTFRRHVKLEECILREGVNMENDFDMRRFRDVSFWHVDLPTEESCRRCKDIEIERRKSKQEMRMRLLEFRVERKQKIVILKDSVL